VESPKPPQARTVQSPHCQRAGSVCPDQSPSVEATCVTKPSIALLAFVVCGGLLFELLRVVPELWSAIVSVFNRLLS
jgi:hypothetical protein